MTHKGQQEERVSRFEIAIRFSEEARRAAAELGLDVLMAPPELAEQGLTLAVASFDEIDRLVTEGVQVTIRSKVPDAVPEDQIATEEQVRARLEEIIRLAEEGES